MFFPLVKIVKTKRLDMPVYCSQVYSKTQSFESDEEKSCALSKEAGAFGVEAWSSTSQGPVCLRHENSGLLAAWSRVKNSSRVSALSEPIFYQNRRMFVSTASV
jgi:hypothetical protein